MRRKSRDNPISLFSFQDIITAVTGIILLLVILLSLSLVQLPETVPSSDLNNDSQDELTEKLKDLRKRFSRAKATNSRDKTSLAMLPVEQLRQKQAESQALAQALVSETTELTKQKTQASQQLEEVFARIKSNPVFSENKKVQQQIEQTQSEIDRLKKNNKRLYNFRGSKKQPRIIDISKTRVMIGAATQNSGAVDFSQASNPDRIKAVQDWLSQNANSSAYFVLIVREDSVDSFRAIHKKLESLGCDVGIDLVGNSVSVLEP